MLKILVCGYGSIGKKHAENLLKLNADVKIWRQRSTLSKVIETDGFAFEPSLESGLDWCDAVVVATSTNDHIRVALQAAKKRKAFYLEKPVSQNKEGLDSLITDSKGLVVEVGCQLRQHPNLKALKRLLSEGKDGKICAFQAWVGQRLDQWRPGTDYRKSYSADAQRGGGALFDLVHEIDLMTWFVGPMSSVYADLRHNSDLEMSAEDLANLVLVAQSGAAGTVQLDMLSPAYRRGFQIICAKALYRWEMTEGTLWRDDGDGAQCIDQVPQDYLPAQMLYEAMAYFLKRLENKSLPASCSLKEGVHDLDILLGARHADKTGARQAL